MKAVILAGGLGTRLSEETNVRPKPMVEIGGKPILWHVMKIYAAHGVTEFIVCVGYRGYMIKEYFANYFLHQSDITFDIGQGRTEVHQKNAEPWRITVVDTGERTMTGGRLRRVREYLPVDAPFFFTYGDGVGDININRLLEFHRASGKCATLTGVQPPGRYGALEIEGDQVRKFQEKPQGDGSWINGGFFVLEPSVIDLIHADDVTWERQPLERLAAEGQLGIYRHPGFWQPMDTLRDKNLLEELWITGKAPWKIW
jgi:glucose-1-phosphate cytidylyltransferase